MAEKVGKWEKVKPVDKHNHTAVYLQVYGDGDVGIAAEMFDQPNVYQMIILESRQLLKLAELLKKEEQHESD